MSETLLTFPGTAVNVAAGGTVAWSNATNARGDDDSLASVTLTNGQTSQYISATNYGFSIPAGAVINGVQVYAEVHTNVATPVAFVARLVNGTLIGNANPNTLVSLEDENNGVQFGGFPDDLWNYPLTSTVVNSSSFGVTFIITNNTGSTLTAFIDFIMMRIVYDTPGGPVYVPRGMPGQAWWLKI